MPLNAARSFLMGVLQLDRMNLLVWYNLGLLYKVEGAASSFLEPVECFEATTFLKRQHRLSLSNDWALTTPKYF
jgi:hypothetical protein